MSKQYLYICKKNTFKNMLKVKKSSLPKAGKGLFTEKEIKKGEVVCQYEGERITWAEAIRRNDKDKGGYVYYITKKNCIDAFEYEDTFGRYANDAAGLGRVKGLRNNSTYDVRDNHVYIVATRKIKAGAEVFVSYGKQYWKIMKEEFEQQQKEEKKKKKKEKKAEKSKNKKKNKSSKTKKDKKKKVHKQAA
jgi:uncharacterized protein